MPYERELISRIVFSFVGYGQPEFIDFSFRNEKTQVEALMEYYEENDGSDKQVLMKVCQIVGQWGIPVVFLVFATVYWTMGMAKYYSG